MLVMQLRGTKSFHNLKPKDPHIIGFKSEQTASIAPIEVKILSSKKSIFSWQERATNGSSFAGAEKRFFEERL